jgi:outer membrane receptor protein involved in Fe transport
MSRLSHGLSRAAVFLSVAVALTLWVAGARAQEKPAGESEVTLEPVVVSSTRLADMLQELRRVPGQVYVITAKDIQQQNARTVQDALRQVPSIVLYDSVGNPFQPTVDLRGFNAQPNPGISVFVDGVRINDPDSNFINFDLIPIQDVERIEVLPGATAVYGANALGGVINITTKRGSRTPQAMGEAAWGSYNHYRFRGAVSGPVKDFDYYVSGTWDRESGYRDVSDGRVTSFTGRVGYRPTAATDLSLTYGYINNRLEQAGTLPLDVLSNNRKANISPTDFSATEQSAVTLQGRQQLPWGFSLAGNAYYRDNSRDLQTTGLSSSGRTFTDTSTPGGTLQLSHDVKFWGLRNSLSVGGEIRHSDVGTASTSTFGPSQRQIGEDSYGLYAQDSLDLLPNLTVTGAVRYDVTTYAFEDELSPINNGDKRFNRVTPRAGLTYTPWDFVTLYGNYGQGFRVPTTDELFAFAGLGSNPNLRPVTSTTYEVGVRVRPLSWLEMTGAYFLTDVRDEILFLPDPTGLTFGQNQNAPESRRQGVEIATRLRPHERVDVQLNYSYTDARYRSQAVLFGSTINPGDRVALVPLHRVFARVAVRPLDGVELSVDGQYVGSQVLLNNETNQTSFRIQDSFVLNAQASYTWKFLTLYIQGLNLTDAKYETYGIYAFDSRTFNNSVFLMPAPGINLLAGLRLRWENYY